MNARLDPTPKYRGNGVQPCNELTRARSALFSLSPNDSREEWVRTAMAAKAAGLSFEDFHSWSEQGEKYKSEHDCHNVWKSIQQDGRVTERTLFSKARQNGWQADTTSPLTLTNNDEQGLKDVHTQGALSNSRTKIQRPLNSADATWNCGEPAPENHPYIVSKGGIAEGMRIYPESAPPLTIGCNNVAGWLMVPCRKADHSLQTIQFISPTGKKLNLPKTELDDGFLCVGDIEKSAQVFVVEGIGQAWAVHSASDAPAVVCFSAGRMEKVAKVLKQRYPTAQLIFLPDRGKETIGEKCARLVDGLWVALPAEKENNYDVNDLLQELGINAVSVLLRSPSNPAIRFPLIPAENLKNITPMEWLIHDVLPKHGLAALYGPSGAGKSFLGLDLAATIAVGEDDWFGHAISPCPVTYVCLEGAQGMAKRVGAWTSQHTASPELLSFMTEPFNLLSDDVDELAKSIKASGRQNGVVIIDTLNRAAAQADENSSADMGRIIAAASKLQSLIGGLVLLIHHSGKDSRQGMRGHSSLQAALDSIIEVGHTGSRFWWKVAKCKDGEDGRQYFFQLKTVLIGKDDQGLDVTSCVVIPGDPALISVQGKAPVKVSTQGTNQKKATQVINEMLEISDERGKGNAPEGAPCVLFDHAVDSVAKRLNSEPKRQKERAKGAINTLIKQGYYCSTEEWLWR